jgi:hypothetical protein
VQGLDKERWNRKLGLHDWFVSISFEFSLIHVLGLFTSRLCIPT